MVEKKVEERCCELFRDGMAPSQIDRELGLPKGTAREAVAHRWKLEGSIW